MVETHLAWRKSTLVRAVLRVIFKTDWFDNEEGWHAQVWTEKPELSVCDKPMRFSLQA